MRTPDQIPIDTKFCGPECRCFGAIIPQRLRLILKTGDTVMMCRHIHDLTITGTAKYRPTEQFTREDGTKGKADYSLACSICASDKDSDFVQYLWDGKRIFHMFDGHEIRSRQ